MIDHKIVGCSWISILPGKFRFSAKPASNCQIEVDISPEDFTAHAPEGEWSKSAPFRVLSFGMLRDIRWILINILLDIECAGRKGVFPEASQDPVIQIANLVTRQGESKPFVKNVFTLGECSNIVGAQVISSKREETMLLEWKKFIQKVSSLRIVFDNTN